MRRLFLTAASLLGLAGVSVSATADPITIPGTSGLTAIGSALPADHPEGVKATVTLVALQRLSSMHDLRLATFVIDYEPGGSAVLHRRRTSPSGYILVHVLSGAIQAQAWSAGLGTYREGQSWVFPAFAENITGKNASADKPARALIVLVTGSDSPRSIEDDRVSDLSQDIAATIR
jgi:quercetin dioxygenase-like cupin family protein